MSDTTQTIAASAALLGAKTSLAGRTCACGLGVSGDLRHLGIDLPGDPLRRGNHSAFVHRRVPSPGGGIGFALWALAKGQRPTWAQLRASVVIGFFFFLIGHGSLHWAEQYVPSGLASLLIAIEPIIVFLLSSAAARVWRMNGMLLAGILLGLVGVGILVRGTGLEAGGRGALGPLAVLIGALSWSIGIIYSRRSKLSGSPLLLSALSLLAGAAMLLTTGTLVGEAKGFSLAQVTPKSWLALGYLIVFGSIIAFTAYNWLLEHYSPTLVATHTYVNPVVAVFLGWLYGGEVITLKVGLAAILGRGRGRSGGPGHQPAAPPEIIPILQT